MRYIAIFATLCLVLTLAPPACAKQMYEAATTIIDMQSHLKGGDHDRHVADLQRLAKSQTVLSRAAETLVRLEVIPDPPRILATLEVEPIKDSSVLMLTVEAESEDAAKATADVVACEFIRYYDEFTGNRSGKPALKILEPAAAGPAPSHFRILGYAPRVFALFAGLVLAGLVVGFPIGIVIGKRRGSRET